MKTFTFFTHFLFTIFLSYQSFAQSLESGLMLGTSYYWGDIEGSLSNRELTDMHPAGGAFARYHFGRAHALRFNVEAGTISADDANSHNDYRNLSFRSNIFEAALIYEVNVWNLFFKKDIRFRPYAFAGVAVFHHNPKALYQDTWYELQPLVTEGQGTAQYPDRKPYALTDFSIPIGGGLEYQLSPRFSIGAEMNFHVTRTDYLDDVSTTYPGYNVLNLEDGSVAAIMSYRHLLLSSGAEARIGELSERGNAASNDGYIFSNLTLSYKFYDGQKTVWKGKNGRVKCYGFKDNGSHR